MILMIHLPQQFFIIDNKGFMSSKSAYENDFWRSCDTEDCSNDAENAFFSKTCCKLYFKLFWQIMILSE